MSMALFRSLLFRGLFPLFVMAGDLVGFYFSLWLSYRFRTQLFERWFPFPFTQTFADLLSRTWMPIVVIVAFSFEGLYTKRRPFWEETRSVVRATVISYLAIFSIVSLGRLSDQVSRAVIAGTGILFLGLAPLIRFHWKPFLHHLGIGVKRALLIGDNPVGRLAQLGLFRDHYMGIRLVGFLQIQKELEGTPFEREIVCKEVSTEVRSNESCPPLPCMGPLDNLKDVVQQEMIRGAVVAMPYLRREELLPLIDKIQRDVPSVYVVPNIAQVNLLNSELLYLFYEEMFLLGIHNSLKFRLNRWGKAVFDVSVAFLLCIPLTPLLGVIAILVAISSPGPILFLQKRIGRDGRAFQIYKFRTMYIEAQSMLEVILKQNPALALEYQKNRKLKNDPRITPIGRFLRRTSLDELPQLLNVLRGEMSLVGPRPAMEEEMLKYYGNLESEYRLVKPGITGLWQVSGRSNNDFLMRVRLDLWYIRNWSLWLDFVILVRTVGVVIGRKGAA